jgi:6-phosphogluconolactonase (cycloisomerase 2 family)
VAGLTGSGLTLSYNGGVPVAISRNGLFTLAPAVLVGTKYSVGVATQPTNPAQTCAVSNGSGVVGNGDVFSVLVYCPQAVGTWAYVATTGSITTTPGVPSVPGSLTAYRIDASSGALSLVPGSTVQTGPAVGTVQLVPHSPYLWVLSIGDDSAADNNTVSTVYTYSVNTNSGLLTANAGNPFFSLNGTATTPAGCNGMGGPGSTEAVTFAPSGTFGYTLIAANRTANNGGTYAFTIAAGAPQALGAAVPQACATPTTVDPSGQFAYYGTFDTGNVYSLIPSTVNPTTGALATVPGYGAPRLVESGQGPATFDPFGRFVYVFGGDVIYGYRINPFDGGLGISGVPDLVSPDFLPYAPISMLISPDGQFAYVGATEGLYTYSIDAFGTLSPVGTPVSLQMAVGQKFAPPGITTAMQLDPSGQFLYVSASAGAGQQGIFAYARDASTGALTLVSGSPFAVTSQTVPLQLVTIN